ncbi:hypothetical protein CLAFUR0_14474 [Fulvia fulva]|nr:hypothetical protein CLAFUR0_14474 [Fulvia fulva]
MKIALQLMLVVSALLTGLVSAYSVVYPDADWELLKEYHDDSPVHKRVANIHGMHFPRVPGINYDRNQLREIVDKTEFKSIELHYIDINAKSSYTSNLMAALELLQRADELVKRVKIYDDLIPDEEEDIFYYACLLADRSEELIRQVERVISNVEAKGQKEPELKYLRNMIEELKKQRIARKDNDMRAKASVPQTAPSHDQQSNEGDQQDDKVAAVPVYAVSGALAIVLYTIILTFAFCPYQRPIHDKSTCSHLECVHEMMADARKHCKKSNQQTNETVERIQQANPEQQDDPGLKTTTQAEPEDWIVVDKVGSDDDELIYAGEGAGQKQ